MKTECSTCHKQFESGDSPQRECDDCYDARRTWEIENGYEDQSELLEEID